jgi:uncharacterized protein YceK
MILSRIKKTKLYPVTKSNRSVLRDCYNKVEYWLCKYLHILSFPFSLRTKSIFDQTWDIAYVGKYPMGG